MLPLSLSSSPLSLPGSTGGTAVASLGGSPGTAATLPLSAKATPGLSSNAMLPMLLQVLQSFVQLMMGMFGKTAGSPLKTSPSGTSPAADLAPGVPGTSSGTPTSLGIPGDPNVALDLPAQAFNGNVNNKRNVNFSKLDEQQRAAFTGPGLDRFATAIIHLGGRSHTGAATDPVTGVGGTARMYARVLANPQSFKPEEVKMVQQFADMEMKESGMITGKYLDYAFIEQMGNRDGLSPDKMEQYKRAIDARVAKQVSFAAASPQNLQIVQQQINTPFGTVSDIGQVQQITGLTKAEQAVYRLAGHSVLFSGDGTVNQDILGITYKNGNSLDSELNSANGGQNVNIDGDIEALAAADMADDGIANGTSLRAAEEKVMDKIFLGGPGLRSDADITQLGQQMGLRGGRSMADITQALRTGGTQALADLQSLAKDHTPAMFALGTSMAAASAVCPFLGGLAAGSAGIGAGAAQKQ